MNLRGWKDFYKDIGLRGVLNFLEGESRDSSILLPPTKVQKRYLGLLLEFCKQQFGQIAVRVDLAGVEFDSLNSSYMLLGIHSLNAGCRGLRTVKGSIDQNHKGLNLFECLISKIWSSLLDRNSTNFSSEIVLLGAMLPPNNILVVSSDTENNLFIFCVPDNFVGHGYESVPVGRIVPTEC